MVGVAKKLPRGFPTPEVRRIRTRQKRRVWRFRRVTCFEERHRSGGRGGFDAGASAGGVAAATAAAGKDIAPFTSATPVAALETNGGGGGGGFAQLTLENNFTMQWEFVDGGENVAFKLRLEMPTWMSIGIHRPGGFGMPNADMLVVQSRDDGANFFVMEAWTMGYDSPRPKSFSGSFANSASASASASTAGAWWRQRLRHAGEARKRLSQAGPPLPRLRAMPERCVCGGSFCTLAPAPALTLAPGP